MESGKAEKEQPRQSRGARLKKCFRGALLLVTAALFLTRFYYEPRVHPRQISPYGHLSSHCANIPPISGSEYYTRQTNLAKALRALNASAYIAEPGANSQFYGNFSSSNWRLSERPLLLIISASSDSVDGEVQPQITILTPKFEATRAKTLPVPNPLGTVQYVEWPEEADPYAAALSAFPVRGPKTVFVDNSIRKFIVDGLQHADPSMEILSAPLAITAMRERKSQAEIDILKCANEVTLLSIRQVHREMYIGIRESQARGMMSEALAAAGLKEGENAALPHGSGTDRSLKKEDFALFDCTAALHGYYSDVTRTVALPDSEISEEHVRIWGDVRFAQSVALNAAKEGVMTREVDLAARTMLELVGYADYFTHRLGHGIGLEVHEQPYLRGGSDDVIRVGHTFSDEPGIYIEGKVGVRLEDCFYIDSEGNGVYLTESVGGQSLSPWEP
ncbi:peptidase M24, structural domain-containing protein [Crassisporium funariophilum]|nr:peptidase M24, structural domain-containing protein [Crassisporium funariophilum]